MRLKRFDACVGILAGVAMNIELGVEVIGCPSTGFKRDAGEDQRSIASARATASRWCAGERDRKNSVNLPLCNGCGGEIA